MAIKFKKTNINGVIIPRQPWDFFVDATSTTNKPTFSFLLKSDTGLTSGTLRIECADGLCLYTRSFTDISTTMSILMNNVSVGTSAYKIIVPNGFYIAEFTFSYNVNSGYISLTENITRSNYRVEKINLSCSLKGNLNFLRYAPVLKDFYSFSQFSILSGFRVTDIASNVLEYFSLHPGNTSTNMVVDLHSFPTTMKSIIVVYPSVLASSLTGKLSTVLNRYPGMITFDVTNATFTNESFDTFNIDLPNLTTFSLNTVYGLQTDLTNIISRLPRNMIALKFYATGNATFNTSGLSGMTCSLTGASSQTTLLGLNGTVSSMLSFRTIARTFNFRLSKFPNVTGNFNDYTSQSPTIFSSTNQIYLDNHIFTFNATDLPSRMLNNLILISISGMPNTTVDMSGWTGYSISYIGCNGTTSVSGLTTLVDYWYNNSKTTVRTLYANYSQLGGTVNDFKAPTDYVAGVSDGTPANTLERAWVLKNRYNWLIILY